jgi:hypothetical protein
MMDPPHPNIPLPIHRRFPIAAEVEGESVCHPFVTTVPPPSPLTMSSFLLPPSPLPPPRRRHRRTPTTGCPRHPTRPPRLLSSRPSAAAAPATAIAAGRHPPRGWRGRSGRHPFIVAVARRRRPTSRRCEGSHCGDDRGGAGGRGGGIGSSPIRHDRHPSFTANNVRALIALNSSGLYVFSLSCVITLR